MTTKNPIVLASDLSTPLTFVTEKLAWIGVTGSGKSYGAQRSAEQLLHAKAPFVVLDPVGNWWGLRLAADGKGDGFPIPVFGGLHGDVPLEPTAGSLIADLIFDKHISAVVDVSQFDTDADRTRFVTAFLDRLYTRHKKAPTARHLYMEECQEFIPQNPQPGEQRMLHVAQRVQKMGRGVGLGTSLITQRPQDVSKKALNQAQTVFLFRLTGSQERTSIKNWVTDKGLSQELLDGLAELPTGTAHIWSPAWLKTFVTVKIARKNTFDASATPEVGAKPVVYELAQIDLSGLKDAMAATIEKAKAEDPKELRRQLAAALAQIKKPAAVTIQEKVVEKIKVVEVPVCPEAALKRLEKYQEQGFALVAKMSDLAAKIGMEHQAMRAEVGKVLDFQKRRPTELWVGSPPCEPFARRKDKGPQALLAQATKGIHIPPETHVLLNGPQQRILAALVFLDGIGLPVAQKSQIALFAGVSPQSGSYSANLAALKTAGLVIYPTPSTLQLSDGGRAAAPKVAVPSTTQELHEAVLEKLSGPQRSILRQALESYPRPLMKADVAAVAGVSAESGSYSANLGHLRGLGLLSYPTPQQIRATDILFLEVNHG